MNLHQPSNRLTWRPAVVVSTVVMAEMVAIVKSRSRKRVRTRNERGRSGGGRTPWRRRRPRGAASIRFQIPDDFFSAQTASGLSTMLGAPGSLISAA
jgi:hypothetical protein